MATSIKEILDSLPPEDRRVLSVAFELEVSQYIKLSDGRYIGVNCEKIRNLVPDPTLTSGVWSVGKINVVQ